MIGYDVMVPSRWYAYLKDDGKPWGISVGILNEYSAVIPTVGRLICDKHAYQSEKDCGEELGWISGKIMVELKKKNILAPKDKLRDEVIHINNSYTNIDVVKELKQVTRSSKRDPISFATNLDFKIQKLFPINEGINKKKSNLAITDSKSAKIFQTTNNYMNLFLDDSVQILPRLPKTLHSTINKIQKSEHKLNQKLVMLEIDYDTHMQELKNLKIDNLYRKIDDYLDKFSSSKGIAANLDWSGRLDLLVEIRNRIKKVQKPIKRRFDILKAITDEPERRNFFKETKAIIMDEYDEFSTTKEKKIGMMFAIASTDDKNILSSLFGQVIEKLTLKEQFPFGYVYAGTKEKESKLKTISWPEM